MSQPLSGTYLGLISGTSMDGVDHALVAFGKEGLTTLGSGTTAYPDELRSRLLRAIEPDASLLVDDIAQLDIELGYRFAAAAEMAIRDAGLTAGDVDAIGSHGQTLRHQREGEYRYSWQIGNAATIAARSGIVTVADFRSLDVAAGGEGAPLVPPFHAWAFADSAVLRIIVNIGGIANLTVIPAGAAQASAGYDTGPGNCLMDEWCQRYQSESFDRDGTWAAQGKVSHELLTRLCDHAYFDLAPPKSTGRELFNPEYLRARLPREGIDTADVQATLAMFTVETIARAITFESANANGDVEVFVCGGGAHNSHLMRQLAARLDGTSVATTSALGVSPDFVEASAFAWLAARRLAGYPTPLTTAAGSGARRLGVVYDPRVT